MSASIIKAHAPDQPVTQTQLASLFEALDEHLDRVHYTLLTRDEVPV